MNKTAQAFQSFEVFTKTPINVISQFNTFMHMFYITSFFLIKLRPIKSSSLNKMAHATDEKQPM